MVNLDTIQLTSTDEQNVLKSIESFYLQLYQAFSESSLLTFPGDYKKVKNVVVCCMGGSRFPAFIVKELFKDKIKVPMIINDDYQLPSFVNNETLVILSSYSGTTEEITHCADLAIKAKAFVTGNTQGGEIAKILNQHKLPFYQFNPIHNPSNQPRIGLGYGMGGILGILFTLNLIDIEKDDVIRAIKKIPHATEKLGFSSPTAQNPAKQLAIQLFEKYPYFIVSEFLTGVGNGIANQVNETAKSISSFRVIPELNHHLMEGLKFPTLLRDIAVFVFFTSKYYSPRIQKRFTITKEVVEQNKIKTVTIELSADGKIEQAFELIVFGSYLSMYLSSLYEQNPVDIPYVNYFKKRMQE